MNKINVSWGDCSPECKFAWSSPGEGVCLHWSLPRDRSPRLLGDTRGGVLPTGYCVLQFVARASFLHLITRHLWKAGRAKQYIGLGIWKRTACPWGKLRLRSTCPEFIRTYHAWTSTSTNYNDAVVIQCQLLKQKEGCVIPPIQRIHICSCSVIPCIY